MKKMYLCVILIASALLPTRLFAYEETRDLKNFNAINYSISGELYIQQGNSYSIKIEGDADDIKKVTTKLDGTDLIIKKTDKHGKDNLSGIKVYITLPKLEKLSIAGNGDVFAPKAFNADNIEISLAGSGDVHFEALNSSKLELSIAGSGNIEMKGNASNKLEINIAGSGDVMADDFMAKDVEVSIAGSGSAKVYANDNLETNIIGSGEVYYKGSPVVEANSIGSGSTKKL